MAEINGAGYRKPDYKLALQYYLEALEEADNVGLHYLSDEYTGLQIKIAEVYEKLGMMEEARLLYREMGTSYIQALADGKTVAPALRPHIIQRDLRVALKTAMLESTINPAVAKMGLLVHFLMAQREVASRDPKIAEMINAEKTRSEINVSIDVDGATNKDQMEAWMPFREELFAARDSK
jgi:tetratricopeptide (TPR) repeat protein